MIDLRPCLLIALCVVATPARATSPIQPDLQRVIEAGALVIEIGRQDIEPMVVTGSEGALSGFDVDLARALALALGVEAKFRRTAGTPDQIVAAVARGEADLGMSLLSATAARARHVLFSRPYATQQLASLINVTEGRRFRGRCPSNQEILDVAAEAQRVAITRQSAEVGWFREGAPEATLTQYPSAEEVFEAVRGGEVMLAVLGEIPARRLLRDHPAAAIRLQQCKLETHPDHIAIAVRPDAPGLVRWIDAFLQERGVHHDASVIVRHPGPWEFKVGDVVPK